MRGNANEAESSIVLKGLSCFQDMRQELCMVLGCPGWMYKLIKSELRDV